MTNRGTLRISRELVDHPALEDGPFDKRSAWLWLLSAAAWGDYRKTVNGVALVLRRGDLAVSEQYLAQRWQWDRSRVRRFLDKLSAEQMIERRTVFGDSRNSAITVVRISNFDHWQGTDGDVTHAVNHQPQPEITSGQEVGVGHAETPNHHRTTNLVDSEPPTEPPTETRNGRATVLFEMSEIETEPPTEPPHLLIANQKHNQKKERTILPFPQSKGRANGNASPTSLPSTTEWPSDAFEQWYALYPKKVDRLDAERALTKVMARGDISFADLLARTKQFDTMERAEWGSGKHRKFTKAPAVWLNKGSYLDETCVVPTQGFEPERDASTFNESDWSQRIAHFQKTGQWSGLWGPKPGTPGCRAPDHLQRRTVAT